MKQYNFFSLNIALSCTKNYSPHTFYIELQSYKEWNERLEIIVRLWNIIYCDVVLRLKKKKKNRA